MSAARLCVWLDLPLATQVSLSADVGRSCILVSMGGKNVMLDCGMHMGYNDEVRLLQETGRKGSIEFISPHPSAEVPRLLLRY